MIILPCGKFEESRYVLTRDVLERIFCSKLYKSSSLKGRYTNFVNNFFQCTLLNMFKIEEAKHCDSLIVLSSQLEAAAGKIAHFPRHMKGMKYRTFLDHYRTMGKYFETEEIK